MEKNNKKRLVISLACLFFAVSLLGNIILLEQKRILIKKDSVCDRTITDEFEKIRRAYHQSKDKKDSGEKYKSLIDKISTKAGNRDDATCVYITTIYYYDVKNYDKAYFEWEGLNRLYENGKIADSRHLSIISSEQIKKDINYFKALEIQSKQLQSAPLDDDTLDEQ